MSLAIFLCLWLYFCVCNYVFVPLTMFSWLWTCFCVCYYDFVTVTILSIFESVTIFLELYCCVFMFLTHDLLFLCLWLYISMFLCICMWAYTSKTHLAIKVHLISTREMNEVKSSPRFMVSLWLTTQKMYDFTSCTVKRANFL